MRFTIEERRVLLDLLDVENSYDHRMHLKGRTTPETYKAQETLYWTLRNKLVVMEVDESPPTQTTSG